jgi:hypothetical protein
VNEAIKAFVTLKTGNPNVIPEGTVFNPIIEISTTHGEYDKYEVVGYKLETNEKLI